MARILRRLPLARDHQILALRRAQDKHHVEEKMLYTGI